MLALLNSRLCYFWLYNQGRRKGETLELFLDTLSEIPIINTDKLIKEKIISIVDNIQSLSRSHDYSENIQKQQAVKVYEKQIDIMVYKLYDLTYSEVKTIDSEFSLSEEEYNNYNY